MKLLICKEEEWCLRLGANYGEGPTGRVNQSNEISKWEGIQSINFNHISHFGK